MRPLVAAASTRPCPVRTRLRPVSLAVLVALAPVRSAHALPLIDPLAPVEVDASSLVPEREAGLSLAVGARAEGALRDVRAGLVFAVPLERFVTSSRARSAPALAREPQLSSRDARASTPPLAIEDRASSPRGGAARERPSATVTAPAERSLAAAIALTGLELREALDQAVRVSGLHEDDRALGDLARRARWSAALPDLRLRAAHASNESAALVPTSYDPLRQTLSGGATLWLEARATWRLDRALFAVDELRIARLAEERHRAREALERRVTELLFDWQEAVAERLDPSASFRECRRAEVREVQRAAELSLLTRGWFDRFRARRPPMPDSDCLATAERVER